MLPLNLNSAKLGRHVCAMLVLILTHQLCAFKLHAPDKLSLTGRGVSAAQMPSPVEQPLLVRALKGMPTERTPVWLMRQVIYTPAFDSNTCHFHGESTKH